MRILAVLTAMAALAVAAPAHADWQWTKWGMTKDEVIAASGGKATPDNIRGLEMPDPLVVQKCSFDLSFEFDSQGRLEAVTLYTEQNCFDDMVLGLTATYGQPVESDTGTRLYVDPVKGNKISIIGTYTSTTIKYRPLPTGL